MKFNETQKNLIALLPAHEIIDKLTDSAKLVLAQIDLLHGTDFAMENGYVYTTNERLCKDTGIRARQTIITAVKVLKKLKLIELESGGRHKANRYRLTDLYYELSGDENPFKNQANEIENQAKEEVPKNKNQAVDIELELEKELEIHECSIPCTGNKLEKTNNDMKYNDEFITENDRGAWEVLSMDDNFDYTQYSDIAEMVKRDAGNKGVKNELSDFDKKNEWCTWAYDELKHLIQILYESWEPSNVLSYANKINSLFDEVDEHINQGWFTKKQIAKFDGMVNNFNSIIRKKSELIDGTGTEQSSVSNENNITSISTSDSDKDGGCAAPSIEKEDNMMIMKATMSEDEITQLSKKPTTQHEEKKYGNYDSIEECFKAFNEKWGLTTQEPMVAYGNSSVKEAQQQFAMALAANE